MVQKELGSRISSLKQGEYISMENTKLDFEMYILNYCGLEYYEYQCLPNREKAQIREDYNKYLKGESGE